MLPNTITYHTERIRVDVSDLRGAADGYDRRAQTFSESAAFCRGELVRLGTEWLGVGADAFQVAGQRMAAKLEQTADLLRAAARELRAIADRFEWTERLVADQMSQVF
jgi:WXG100 family type VII secretion target